MAKDLAGTGVTVNVLVPGGVTNTGMVPPEAGYDRAEMIQPAVMAPPLDWLVSMQPPRYRPAFSGGALGYERPRTKRGGREGRRSGGLDRHRDHADRTAAPELIGRVCARQKGMLADYPVLIA